MAGKLGGKLCLQVHYEYKYSKNGCISRKTRYANRTVALGDTFLSPLLIMQHDNLHCPCG